MPRGLRKKRSVGTDTHSVRYRTVYEDRDPHGGDPAPKDRLVRPHVLRARHPDIDPGGEPHLSSGGG